MKKISIKDLILKIAEGKEIENFYYYEEDANIYYQIINVDIVEQKIEFDKEEEEYFYFDLTKNNDYPIYELQKEENKYIATLSTGSVRRVDDLGRICIPRELREKLNIKSGQPIEFFTQGDNIVLKKYIVEEEESEE